jgi:integrase
MSELLGLRWDKVDFDRGEVHIHRTLDTVKGQTVLKEATKTDSSRRTLPVGKYTLDALKGLHDAAKGHPGYVFGDEGKAVSRYAFDHRWKKFLKKLGLPKYTFHQCRHSVATRLLRGGAYLTAVSKRLGHSKPSITLDAYSDALPSDQGPLTDAFDQDMSRIMSR